MRSSLIIHLDWDGPHTWSKTKELNRPKDYGVYQVYGCHPVYGGDTLLYIGKAEDQNFATRLGQEHWDWAENFQGLTFYTGRLHGRSPDPSIGEQRKQIELAEKLLILAHKPAHNCQKGIDYQDAGLREVHILNWNSFRSLLPEVSGWRYSSKYWTEMHDFERQQSPTGMLEGPVG